MARKKSAGKKKSNEKKEAVKTAVTTANFNTKVLVDSTLQFVKGERFKIILGVFSLFFSVFLTLSFVSYLFTWKDDQSLLSKGFIDLIASGEHAENIMGKLGAFLSDLLIHDWFGVISFLFIFLMVLLGFKLLKYELLPLGKSSRYSILIIIWFSITLSYIFDDNVFFPGGAHGYFVSQWLNSAIGKIGTGFFLLMFLVTFIMLTLQKTYEKISLSTNNLIKPEIKAFFGKILFLDSLKTTSEKNEMHSEKDVDMEISKRITNKANTSENSKVIEKKEYVLNDDGIELELTGNVPLNNSKKVLKDEKTKITEIKNEDLNFETVNTKEKVSEQIVGQKPDIDKNLSIIVEKNQDIVKEEIEDFPAGDYDPTLELSSYQYPTLDLLQDHKSVDSEVSNEELISNKNRIVETLKNYKIDIQKIKATIGPTITLYEIIPAPGVRISKIKSLEDDIALSLSALGIRIIAPMPGRGTVGIEVPNRKPEIVSMRSLISTAIFQETKYELPVALGKTISNETFVFDLAKMPHLLVAGATGQGKSVGLNVILTSLLYKKHPSQIKFVLVDPKKVELTLFEKIERHFLAKLPESEEAIITDNQKVIYTLSSLNVEMDSRYDLLKLAQVRNIKEYNEKFIARKLNPNKGHRYLPYIVLVVDEFADLIMTAGKEVELPIARLAQLARAIGIHLIIATQRPSTNIITGSIKANFPARIAFKVASMIDSRTILDSPGANQLIGRGDMLITQGNDLIRLQCAFLDTNEVERITDFIGNQRGYTCAHILPEPEKPEGDIDSKDVDLGKKDPLFNDAARLIVINQQGSTSLIQRKLSIGYNRAGRIIDQLEVAGIVGPFEGSKAREVLITDDRTLEQILSSLENR